MKKGKQLFKNLILGILFAGMISSVLSCAAAGGGGGDDGIDDPVTVYTPVDTSYAKTITGGIPTDVSALNGSFMYGMLSYLPGDKKESNSPAEPAYSDWTISSSMAGTLSRAAPGSDRSSLGIAVINRSTVKSAATGQSGWDLKMREGENRALADAGKQFSRSVSGTFSKAPSSITVGTTVWSGITIPLSVPYATITATCRYASYHAYFFVDNRDTVAMSALLAGYGDAFDAIYDVNHARFGLENDVDGNGKVIIVFSRELENYNTDLLGYFNSHDKYAAATYDDSNEGDIFYMTTYSDWQGDTIKATLAHEFQHMIYFDEHADRHVTSSYTWLNEALSQAAEFYNGYLSNHHGWINGYLNQGWYGLSLTHWTPNNYGYGAIFIRYLIDRYGNTAIYNMCSTDKVGVAAVEAATGEDFNTIFYNFANALVLSNTGVSTVPEYAFDTLNLRTVQSTPRLGLRHFSADPVPDYIATTSGKSYNYPYEIFFTKCTGTFGNISLSGKDIVGTFYKLAE